MMFRRACLLILSVCVVASTAPAQQAAATKAIGPREPLTYRDSGIYGWWQPYFWEGPFDFLVTQAIVVPGDFTGSEGTNNATDLEHIRIWNDNLKKARAAGKRVLVVCSPGQGRPYTEEYFKHLELFLDNVDHQELYAISLGEENITAPDWVKALTDGYHRIKARYPDLPVYQWYSCSSRADARPGFTWPLLPSDGWIADEYVAESVDFEQAIRRYRMLGKPVVNIIWAAPFYSSSRQTSVPYHQQIFDGQVRVSAKYDVPTAYFCWDGPLRRFWPWHDEGEQENKDVFKLVLAETSKAKTLPAEALSNWDNDAGDLLPCELRKGDDGAYGARETFDLWHSTLPQRPEGSDFMARLRIRGLRHMSWMPEPSRIVIKGDGATPVDASLTHHWVAAGGAPLRLVARASVAVESGTAAADVVFEASPNGYDWVVRTSEVKDGVMTIELPGPSAQVYTRLRVAGTAERSGQPLVSVDAIEVQGTTAQ